MNQTLKGKPFDGLLLHICEVCGRTEVLTPQEAFDEGWDYPPMMGSFGVVSPRTCPNCLMVDTAWAAMVLHGKSLDELTDRQKETVERIIGEPKSIMLPGRCKRLVFYTGDIHGMPWNIVKFSKKFHLTEDDVIVILGDVGANYYCDDRDRECKAALNKVKPSILCIHGNHEARPSTLPQYQLKEWKGGLVWYEKDYPNLLFAKDGEIFDLEGMKHLVIGGAYSVDKFYRLAHGANWFPDEQPSAEIKAYVEQQIREKPFDIVMSHTCPFKYEPTEVFLPMIDQDSVDASTEHWLDGVEEQIRYKAWFCGHWHIDKRIDRMHFLFHSFESNEQFNREEGAQ